VGEPGVEEGDPVDDGLFDFGPGVVALDLSTQGLSRGVSGFLY
jgi:hypothetical protein